MYTLGVLSYLVNNYKDIMNDSMGECFPVPDMVPTIKAIPIVYFSH